MKPFWTIQAKEPREAAPLLAKMGVSFIPLGHNKKPLGPWKEYQSRPPSVAEALTWAKNLRHMQIGLVTGRVNNISVVDFDHPQAEQWWLDQGYPLSEIQQQTRRGRHQIFRFSENTRTGKGFGPPFEAIDEEGEVTVAGRLDIRSEGGYIVWAPSHINGHTYKVITPDDLPEDFQPRALDFLLKGFFQTIAPERAPPPQASQNTAPRQAHAPGEVVEDGLGRATEGRETRLREIVLSHFRNFVDQHGRAPLSNEEVGQVAADVWDEFQLRMKPRPGDGNKYTLDGVRRKILSTRKRYESGDLKFSRDKQEALADPAQALLALANTVQQQPFIAFDPEAGDDGDDGWTGSGAPAQRTATVALTANWFDPSYIIPRRSWLIKNLAARKYLTFILAPPGVGKTTISADLLVTYVSGAEEWCGYEITATPEGRKAWLYNGEDEKDELYRRVTAAAQARKVKPEYLAGRLAVDSGADRPIKIANLAQDSKVRKLVKTGDVEALVKIITDLGIDLAVFDPLQEAHEANENDNLEMKFVAATFREVAQKSDCAIVIIHHTRKMNDDEGAGNFDIGRGASAISGVARFILTLLNVAPDAAAMVGIPLAEQHKFVRLDEAKSNLSMVTKDTRWFKRIGIDIGNGADGGLPDEVGYLEQWHPRPVGGELTPEIVTQMLDEVQAAARENDPYSAHPQAKRNIIGMMVYLSNDLLDSKRAKLLFQKWIKEKVLLSGESYSASRKCRVPAILVGKRPE
ncbi:AAA family ATPase [Skermanella rosea]|uniref:AAA family ATPase n=1 Tax=Skermanella rosea TaxID=1817965 RepID=UPI001933FCC0|nr:AAA family ATPase [Skermanella rosea]UEM03356.1 AAA family ATPase [Skermanella rosea]